MTQSRSLYHIKDGQSATIQSFDSSIPATTVRRLQEMGLNRNRLVQILHHGPFKGPISIAIGGLVLALDIDIAEHILVSQ